jgi:molecular chaperone GrpE
MDHEQREDDEQRPRIRIVDKRRYRDGEAAPDEGSGAAASAGSGGDAGAEDAEAELAVGSGDELERARAEAAEYRDHLQRLQAEFENYRKRMTVSQSRLVETELQRFVGRLLEVLDEFDLALMAAERTPPGDRTPDFDSFRKGVELVYAKLAETLRGEGLERIDAEGKEFDPNEHEALLSQPAEGAEAGSVLQVLQKGYRLGDVVVRPARVIVAE